MRDWLEFLTVACAAAGADGGQDEQDLQDGPESSREVCRFRFRFFTHPVHPV
jgi:hypothetical protein